MDEVPKDFENVSPYVLYVCNEKVMKEIENKSKASSSRRQGGDDMEMVEFYVTEGTNAMSVETYIAFNFCVFNEKDYHSADLFVRKQHTEGRNISTHDASLSHVISFSSRSACMVLITPTVHYQ